MIEIDAETRADLDRMQIYLDKAERTAWCPPLLTWYSLRARRIANRILARSPDAQRLLELTQGRRYEGVLRVHLSGAGEIVLITDGGDMLYLHNELDELDGLQVELTIRVIGPGER